VGSDYRPDFISSLADTELILEAPLAEDYLRSAEILRQYADANLDFVDALIAATAERLNIKRLLTLDRRDFSIDSSQTL
jgi:predicted nucleic acid-binding protein